MNKMMSLFKPRRKSFLNMFSRRRNNNRSMIWGSLLSLGMSAAAYGLSKRTNRNLAEPLQNMMRNTNFRNLQPNLARVANEFAEEIAPDRKPQ